MYQQPRQVHRESVDRWPISLDEIKEHNRLQDDHEDTFLLRALQAAVTYAQNYTDLVLPLTGYTWSLDSGDLCSQIRLPLAPVRRIQSIKWFDSNNLSTEFTPDEYAMVKDGGSGRLHLPPLPTARSYNAIEITFLAGFGDVLAQGQGEGFPYTFPITLGRHGPTWILDWPEDVKHAIHMLVAHWFENRAGVIVGTISGDLTKSVDALLSLNRVRGT